ncbi:MAG: SDR family NAD(P)-dependent oxidoreductase [Clostridiales bacterium]|nr:SDR family NAD(P)-dependent oxidoreductase [Clostridiales bacterium]
MTLEEAKEYAKQNVKNRLYKSGRLSGKIAVVTGSAQGFGLGIAREMHKNGASVMVADLEFQREKALEVVKEFGDGAAFVSVDVSDEASVENMICETVRIFGGLDIIVSNAGVAKAGSLHDMDLNTFEFVEKINYRGYFLCAKYASEIMKAEFEADNTRYSDIIQINSKSGIVGSKNNFAYSGSKFGGIGLTQSFALELAPYNIKVNAVCPGNYYDGPLWSDPERGLFIQYLKAGKVPGAETVEDVKRYYLSKQPMDKRGCFPSDVAKAIFYCVEQEFETGQAIPVTGGQVMLA